MRRAIRSVARWAALAVGLAVCTAAHADAAGGNVLLLVADDLGIDASDLYASPPRLPTAPAAAPMPNLRRLAKQGLLFNNAWATPGCSPTRATIFTGRYPFRTGVGDPLPPDPASPTPILPPTEFGLPRAFAGTPYLLAHIGKWHLSRGIGDPNLYGWPYFAGPDPSQTAGGIKSYFRWPKTVNGVTATSTAYNTTDVVDETIGQIRAAKLQKRPYFIWAAFAAVHAPFHKPPNELHSRDSLPANGGKPYGRAYFEAMIEALDTEIGRLLKEVDLATTTVIFLGDNGTPATVTAPPYLPDHAKLSVYEGGVRVPLLFAGAQVAARGRKAAGLASTVDLFPTILQLAGIDAGTALPAGTVIDGVSLLPVLSDRSGSGSVRPLVYTETFPLTFDVDYGRAIRTSRFKLIDHADGTQQMFDLIADPLETADLLARGLSAVQKRKYSYLRKSMRTLLATR
ncbi:MAG: sulfatase-like hydrolase/transferase [Geminicoccaceae bacterium]